MDEINNPILWGICKSAQINVVKATNVIANIVLGIGLIGGLITVIIGLVTNTEYYGYSPDWILFGCGLAAIVNSAIIWAMLKMLVAIYIRLDKE
ncbi:hypothetical protein [Alistipes putredinis]|uniref:hypothetical protein n=1 Tax=Alistipes putredinis TaxID=28117 RepID=UPI003AB7FDFD